VAGISATQEEGGWSKYDPGGRKLMEMKAWRKRGWKMEEMKS
jgi:hypothetical protein